MSEVTFIELKVATKDSVVCDIAEKLYTAHIRTTIYCSDKQQALRLDNLLWTWRQDSFVPHSYVEHTGNSLTEPVIITDNDSIPAGMDALILYDPLPISHIKGIDKIIDFAEVYHPDKLNESRQRYKEFRDVGQFSLTFSPVGAFLNA